MQIAYKVLNYFDYDYWILKIISMKKIFYYFIILSFYSKVAFALNLNETLIQTYQNNPALKAAFEFLQFHNEKEFKAISDFLPNISANFNRRLVNAKQDNLLSRDWRDNTKSLTIKQPIFSGGKSIANLKQAKNEVDAECAKFLHTEQTILLSAIKAYADVIEHKQLVELSNKKVETFGKHLYAATERERLRDATKSEVARAAAKLSGAQTELLKNISKYEATQAAFENITGLKAEGLEIPDISQFQEVFGLEELKAIALASNPTLLESSHKVEASRYDVLKQTSSFLPNANLSYEVSKNRTNRISGIDRLDKTLALNVTIPLYQSGVEYSNLRGSKKLYSGRKYEHKKTMDSVIEEAVKAWHEQRVAVSLIESTKAEEKAASIALDSVKQEAEMQLNTITDVLDAEQILFHSYAESVKACNNLMKAYYNLQFVTGKLTAKDLSLNIPLLDTQAKRRANKIKVIGF